MVTMAALRIAKEKLQLWEDCKLKPYEDAGGWAVGYGHQLRSKDKDKLITHEQALAFLSEDIARAAAGVVTRIGVGVVSDMTAEQQAAVVSFAYNVGVAAFSGSTLAICLVKRDFNAVPEQLARWNKDAPNGNVLPGLVARRYNEAMLFLI